MFFAAMMFISTLANTPSPAAQSACWQLMYSAISHSASSPHARYVSYKMFRNVTRDGQRYDTSNASIVYRDDGIEYVDDDRRVHPFLSGVIEPGAPVLGPFGDARNSWLSLQDVSVAQPLPVIANTHTTRYTCIDRGDEIIEGGRYAHIDVPDAPNDRSAVRGMWVES